MFKRLGYVLAILGYLVAPIAAQQVSTVGVASGTTGIVSGGIPGVPGYRTWLCGFDLSGVGSAVAPMSPVTVSGTAGSSFFYNGVLTATATAAGTPLNMRFNPCIPSSAANQAISVTTTADGTATAVNMQAWGYYAP